MMVLVGYSAWRILRRGFMVVKVFYFRGAIVFTQQAERINCAQSYADTHYGHEDTT